MKVKSLCTLFPSLCLLAAIAIQAEKPPNNDDAVSAEPLKNPSTEVPEVTQRQAVADHGKVPLSFKANQDQTATRVNFFSRGRGYTLFDRSGGGVRLARVCYANDVKA